MRSLDRLLRLGLSAAFVIGALACSSSGGDASSSSDGATDAPSGSDGAFDEDAGDTGSGTGDTGSGTGDTGSGTGDTGSGTGDTGSPPGDGGTSAFPAGWLYTQGSKILVSNGTTGTPWMGRGVNVDDIFLCGYDNTLWMTKPEDTLTTILDGLLSGWKPTFLRLSLSMNSYPTVPSWTSNQAQYATPMTNVIKGIGTHPGVYVLVTLRSEGSMIDEDTTDGDPEATGIPSDSTNTPNKTKYPTGTDATYVGLVDSFAHDPFVLFGITNEPGGNKTPIATIAKAMDHAVGVIRAEEDKLGVPHHIVSVQGFGWTSDISYYATKPLAYDNVVYEVHGYPPSTSSYTYSNIPVIIGEYGTLSDANAFYADVESKQIPNLAWDFEPYSNCSPDLVDVTTDATKLNPTAWGNTVKGYLAKHP